MGCFTFAVAAATAAGGGTFAAVKQPSPDNRSLPQPVSAVETSVVTSRGFPAEALTLDSLFKHVLAQPDPIDPVADAQTTPGVFSR